MLRILFTIFAVLVASGCASNRGGSGSPADYVKPTIAVMKFESRAPFPLHWDLGTGTRDVLVNRLVVTDRYHVIERPELDSVLQELHFEQSGLTRPEERAKLGLLKNVQYLIKGTITDFTHVSSGHGFLGNGSFSLFGGGNRAVMGVTMYVVDVQSGEIIAAEGIQESVSASDMNVQAVYKDVAFGGSVFYRTPLGEATAKVIDRAVERITATIAARPWVAKVALVQADGNVVLNGGKDRFLRVGDEFEVCSAGEVIRDPDNGDIIGRLPGKPVGRCRVVEVQDLYSIAATLSATEALQIGQQCRKPSRQ